MGFLPLSAMVGGFGAGGAGLPYGQMRGGAVGPAPDPALLQPKGPLQQKQPSLEDFERDYWAPDREQVLADMRNPPPPPAPNWGEYPGAGQSGTPGNILRPQVPGQWGTPGWPQDAPEQGPPPGMDPTAWAQGEAYLNRINGGRQRLGMGGGFYGGAQGGFMPLSNFANWGGMFGNLFNRR